MFLDRFRKKKMQPDSDIGTVLMKMHLIDAVQLTEAVELQKVTIGFRLGEALVAIKAITQEQLDEALSLQNRLRGSDRLGAYIEITQSNFKSAAKHLTPKQSVAFGKVGT